MLLLVLAGCTRYREVGVTFGEEGEGLDGFLCKESGRWMLDREATDAGLRTVSIVTDIVGLSGGAPGCRTGQLMTWCRKANVSCAPKPEFRRCHTVQLPMGNQAIADRDELRKSVRTQLSSLGGVELFADTPDEHVILRMVATLQPCSEVEGATLELEPTKLLGCAYSCPTNFDRTTEDVYLGFETLVGQCEQGVRICASTTLKWQL